MLGVSSSCALAADAGARIGDLGGNAVDAALAAALVSAVTEPGVVSLGGGAFVMVWPPAGEPVVIDGHVEMPGRGLAADQLGTGRIDIWMEYGRGVATTVGPGSVGTPGLLAAFEMAWEGYGSVDWQTLFDPAYEYARDGFPLSQPSYDYLIHSGEPVFSWDPASRAVLYDSSGQLLDRGAPVYVKGLAESVRAIADRGAREMYTGRVGARIVDGLRAGGGILTHRDLASYQAVAREPLSVSLDGWAVATTPAPSHGGTALAAMLTLMSGHPVDGWDDAELLRLIRAQEMVLSRTRQAAADRSLEDREKRARQILDAARGPLRKALESPSTVHTSAVDSTGLACSVTISAGYGSGALPGGAGIWMNNCLGEIELSPEGFHGLAPGTRLHSNMAPTVARRADGAVLAIGSPGASRIPTAMLLTLLYDLRLELPLQDAIDAPRLHVSFEDDEILIDYEEGLDVDRLDVRQRRFERSMYFGGVAAVRLDPGGSFSVAADPRRSGSVAISNGDSR